MQKLKLSNKEFEAGSFNRIFKNMERFDTCSMTGFRSHKYDYGTPDNVPNISVLPGEETEIPATYKDNLLRNKILESEIRKSELGFNKAVGYYLEEVEENGKKVLKPCEEISFIIYNTLYKRSDFEKLCIELGRLFSQDSILITHPNYKKDLRVLAGVSGELIITNPKVGSVGSVMTKFNHVTQDIVKDYYTSIYGRSYSFKNIISGKEPLSRVSGMYGRMAFDAKFAELYPNLVD